ncbi:hypothetical protein FRC20_004539 [Serendipita sp. 405]|nr:hypothetical protein FRC20_004539 [Serendipita sp. 405]
MSGTKTAYGPSGIHNMTPEARNQLQETYYPGYTGDSEASQTMTLDSLQDPPPGTKPRYPYSTLIRYAIKGSPSGRLLLEDIYYALGNFFFSHVSIATYHSFLLLFSISEAR